MYQLRCTKKAQDALGLKSVDLSKPSDENVTLGNWYVNVFTQNRRKCLLVMEEKTLITFVLVGLRKEHINGICKIFKNGVVKFLQLEGFPAKTISAFESASEQVIFTKTASKTLLSSMNDLMSLYNHFIDSDGGIKNCDLTEITMRVNRRPQRTLHWKFSIDALHEALAV